MKKKILIAVTLAALISSMITIILLGVALSDANKEIEKLKVNDSEYKEQLSMCEVELSVCKSDVEEAWTYHDALLGSYIDLGLRCGAFE